MSDLRKYQEAWVESLEEFSTPWQKPRMENNLLGVCCEVIGDDTGDTDPLARSLAKVLQRLLMEKLVAEPPFKFE